MAIETEIKLSLPPRAATQLAKHPLLAGIKPLRQRLLNTYYDTPDLRLQRERIAVRYRKKGWQWLFTVKCAAPSAGGLARRNEWEVPALPGEFDFSHVDNKKLRHLLESLRAELTPAFTTNFVRNAWLIEPQTGVRIELALDRGWIECKGRRAPICEVELELLEGDVDALFAAASTLQANLPLHPEVTSKAERGYRLYAGTALAPVKALPATINRGLTAIQPSPPPHYPASTSCKATNEACTRATTRNSYTRRVLPSAACARRYVPGSRYCRRDSSPALMRVGKHWPQRWARYATVMFLLAKLCPS